MLIGPEIRLGALDSAAPALSQRWPRVAEGIMTTQRLLASTDLEENFKFCPGVQTKKLIVSQNFGPGLLLA